MAIPRGWSARSATFPTFERKPRTIERVNDEIVAAIVATLREAGLDAQPGNEDALTLSDEALVVSGRIRPSELSQLRQGQAGRVRQQPRERRHGGVDVLGPRQEAVAGLQRRHAKRGKPPAGKQAAARNAAIAEALAAQKAPPEKLSPDVEAPARRLGRAVGEKIVAYAKEPGLAAGAA